MTDMGCAVPNQLGEVARALHVRRVLYGGVEVVARLVNLRVPEVSADLLGIWPPVKVGAPRDVLTLYAQFSKFTRCRGFEGGRDRVRERERKEREK